MRARAFDDLDARHRIAYGPSHGFDAIGQPRSPSVSVISTTAGALAATRPAFAFGTYVTVLR